MVNSQKSCIPEATHKLLRTVPYTDGFHFFMPDGHYTGETALSLCSFFRDLGAVDVQSIRFHFDRGDFQKWLRNTLSDVELVRLIDELDKKIPEENFGEKLAGIAQKRISEL